jgi:hypothetical protein
VVPAGDGQDFTGHEGRFVAGQESDHVGNLLGPAQAPKQASIEESLKLLLGEPLDDAGADDPGGDAMCGANSCARLRVTEATATRREGDVTSRPP